MSGPQSMHLRFHHQGADYDINLIKGKKSNHTVKIGGVTYAVLGKKGQLEAACAILRSVSLNSISSEEDLKGRLTARGDISFPTRKTEGVGVRTLTQTRLKYEKGKQHLARLKTQRDQTKSGKAGRSKKASLSTQIDIHEQRVGELSADLKREKKEILNELQNIASQMEQIDVSTQLKLLADLKHLKSRIITFNQEPDVKAALELTNRTIDSIYQNLNSTTIAKVRSEEVSNRQRLAGIRKEAQSRLHLGDSAETVARDLSLGLRSFLADLFTQGIDTLREQGFGKPPCEFAFEVFGSLARLESGPYPDIDCMLVIETKTPSTVHYFEKLTQEVADRLYRLGESSNLGKTGLRFCDGGLSPPYQSYDYRHSADKKTDQGIPELLSHPSPDNPLFMDPSAMNQDQQRRVQDVILAAADVSLITGSDDLYRTYMTTHQSVRAASQSAEEGIRMATKRLAEDQNPIITQSIPGMSYVKGDFYRFPQVIVSYLAEMSGIEATNTFDRIRALRDLGVFDNNFADQLLKAMDQLVKFRILVQAAYGEEFELVSTVDWKSFKGLKEQWMHELESLKKESPSEGNQNRIGGLEAQINVWPKVAQQEFVMSSPSNSDEKIHKAILSESELVTLRDKTLPTLLELYNRAVQSAKENKFNIGAYKHLH
jgi:hypothetical protein